MTLDQALHLVNELAGAGGALAGLAAKIRDFLNGYRRSGSTPTAVLNALQVLPFGASAEQVVHALGPPLGVGGSLFLGAGHDGGGGVTVEHANLAAGSGPAHGGDAVVKAGDGGPHGPGGNVVIRGGTIKAGDAK